MACVSEGDNWAVDARAGGVYVVDGDNALRRAFLGASESVARWLVEAENAGTSTQQRPARHLHSDLDDDGVQRMWRRSAGRRDHNDAVSGRTDSYPYAVFVEVPGQQGLYNADVFRDERLALALIKSALVTGQPLSKLGRLAVQRDQVQRHGRKVKLGGDLRTVPASVLVCQVVPGAASPTCSRLALYRWGNQLCGKAFGQVEPLRVERTDLCCHPSCRVVTISSPLLTNVAAPLATSCCPTAGRRVRVPPSARVDRSDTAQRLLPCNTFRAGRRRTGTTDYTKYTSVRCRANLANHSLNFVARTPSRAIWNEKAPRRMGIYRSGGLHRPSE